MKKFFKSAGAFFEKIYGWIKRLFKSIAIFFQKCYRITKKFFKSVIVFFKENYKPLLAIVLIAVISGGLLALGNDVFNVSDEERQQRDLKKIYSSASFTEIALDNGFKTNASFGEVVYVFEAADSTAIIKAKSAVQGYNGYSEIVIAIGSNGVIKNLIISTFGGDDRTSSVNKKYLNNAYVGNNVFEIDYFYMGGAPIAGIDVSSGATSTKTMKSVCAAVNMTLYYFKNTRAGGAE